MNTVTCPYCRHTHRTGELLLSCAGCGDAAKRFPAATLGNGRCPHGRLPQARRSCPTCARDLPREYVDTAGRPIVVMGPPGAGKSTWVAAVIRQFAQGEVARRFPGLSLDLLGEDSRLRYREEFERPLLGGTASLRPTVMPTGENRTGMSTATEPLLLSLRLPSWSRPLVIVLYDTTGEHFSAKHIAAYFGVASGILLLVDPMRLPRVRGVTAAERPHTEVELWYRRLGAALREGSRLPAQRGFGTPLAIAIAKVDTIWEMFDESSPMRLPSPHGGQYVEADGLDVHYEVSSWLGQWFAPEFIQDIAANFPVHRYFGFSALGHPPAWQLDVSSYRVEDPLLWFMARFGAIKTLRGRR